MAIDGIGTYLGGVIHDHGDQLVDATRTSSWSSDIRHEESTNDALHLAVSATVLSFRHAGQDGTDRTMESQEQEEPASYVNADSQGVRAVELSDVGDEVVH